jgi:hypothetical protein
MNRTAITLGSVALSALFLGGSAIAVSEIVTSNQPATVKVVPGPTKTIIKHKTKVIHEAAPAPAQAAPAQPAAGSLREAAPGVYAGPNTSNEFALNVAASWDGTDGVQQVYSPVTGQTYSMTYTTQADGSTVATGGNNAYVKF